MQLKDIIAEVESNRNEKAIRFEPITFQAKPLWIVNQIVRIQYAHGGKAMIDYDTALSIGCTSYGKYQILGANLYGPVCGVYCSIFDYVYDIQEQDKAFAKFVTKMGYDPNEDISHWDAEHYHEFASFYNGPEDVADYVLKMQKAQNVT